MEDPTLQRKPKRKVSVPPVPKGMATSSVQKKKKKRSKPSVQVKQEPIELGPPPLIHLRPARQTKRKRPDETWVNVRRERGDEDEEEEEEEEEEEGAVSRVTISAKSSSIEEEEEEEEEEVHKPKKSKRHRAAAASSDHGEGDEAEGVAKETTSTSLTKTGNFKKRWEELLAPPKPPSPGKADLELVLRLTERTELFTDNEWERNKNEPAFTSLQAQKDKLSNLKAEVDKGAMLVLSLWGSKGAGKSWTANALIEQLLNCQFPEGEAPLPSFSGFKDGSPWPIFIRFMPSVTETRAYRETCSKQEYLTRVKGETAQRTDEAALVGFGCVEREAEVLLDQANPIGAEIHAKFSKQVPLCDLPPGLSPVDALRRIQKALLKLRGADMYDNLLTNACVIEVKHELGVELRDIPGVGHGDWRWQRDTKAVRGTDIACVVLSGEGRLITPDELDNLHKSQLYAEQNFVYNQPPKLVVLPNMTKRKELVLPDESLKGDSGVPFVELIRKQIHEALQPNTRLMGSTIMWEGIDEDLRPDMLAKARESLEIIPFYPRPVQLLSGETYDSIQLLCGVVEQQKAQKLANMCSVGMRLARTWLFHAWSAVAKAKKMRKGEPAPGHNEFIKQLDELSKSFKQQYIGGLATKIQPDGEAVDCILHRVAPLLEKSVKLDLDQSPSALTDKGLRVLLTGIQEQALKEIMKEVDLWIKRKLKEIKPLRRVLVQDLKRPFHQLHDAVGMADAEEGGLTGAHFPLKELQGQEEEVFKEVQEWLVGNKMVSELETLTRKAYAKAMANYVKGRQTEMEEMDSVREELEWVLYQAVHYTLCGDPSLKKPRSVEIILREVITNPKTNRLKPSYFRGMKELIDAVTLSPEQFTDMSKRQEQKLKELNRQLVNYGAAAPKGARPPSYYNPVTVRKRIDALRQASSQKPALAKNKEKQWIKCQSQSMNNNLTPVKSNSSPKVQLQDVTLHRRHITTSRDTQGIYTFFIPNSLQKDYDTFLHGSEDAAGRLQCPLVAAKFSTVAMAQLWPCIQRLDQFEPNNGGQYFLFVVVTDDDWEEAQRIFESYPSTYLVRLPKPRSKSKDAHEPLEVAKQLGEALGPTLGFDVHYVLSESVEFIREYDSKQCQMVPSTYYRAFQEGLRVYKHLEEVYKKELLRFLEPKLQDIAHLCSDTKAIMQQQSTLLKDPANFNVQNLLDLLPSTDSFLKKIDKLQKKLNKLLKKDKPEQVGKCKEIQKKIKKLKEKKEQLSTFKSNVGARRGAFRIGPIFIANVSNGDNKCNHACSGTYFPTKSSVTNLALFNTKSMQPYSVVSVKKRRGPTLKKPLVPLAEQMWADGRPPVVVFNFEYYPKIPKVASQHLDQVKSDLSQLEEQEVRQYLEKVPPEQEETDDEHQ